MKKKLEAELISIAHKILQLKNKSDIDVLYQQTQLLYEKLSVLKFVEENFADAKPTIGYSNIEDKLAVIFESDAASANETLVETTPVAETTEVAETETAPESETPIAETTPEPEPEVAPEPEAEEEVSTAIDNSYAIPEFVRPEENEPKAEEIQPETPTFEETKPEEIPAAEVNTEVPVQNTQQDVFVPAYDLAFEPLPDEKKEIPEPPKSATPQFSFDDLLGKDYSDPVFVKPEDQKPKEEYKPYVAPVAVEPTPTPIPSFTYSPPEEKPAPAFNPNLTKGITIGLNDRVAFMKHLFANSSEDYNRVLSQLMTFNTFDEAKNFIDDMVKPDYNNWDGKDEYAERFMEIVSKRFS